MKGNKSKSKYTRRDFLKTSGALAGGLALNLMGPGRPFIFAQTKEPIKLGYIDILSGPFATVGRLNQVGTRMAEKHINAAGGIMGRPLKIYLEDSEGKAQQAADKAQKLILDYGVIAVHGGTNTAEVLSSMGVCKRYGVIHHKFEMDSRTVAKSMFKLSYRAQNTDAEPVRAMAWHFGKNMPHIKRWTTLTPDNAWGRDCWDTFVEASKKSIKDVKLLEPVIHPFGTADFTSYIMKLKDLDPQGVMMFNWGGDFMAFMKQQKPFGLMKKIEFTHYAPCPDVCLTMGKDMEQMWVAMGEYNPQLPAFQKFMKMCEDDKEFGRIPGDWTPHHYDSVFLMKKAIEKAGKDEPKAIIKAIEGMEFEGVTGWLRIRPESHFPDKKWFYIGHLEPTKGSPYFTWHKIAAIPNDQICFTDEEARAMGADFPYKE